MKLTERCIERIDTRGPIIGNDEIDTAILQRDLLGVAGEIFDTRLPTPQATKSKANAVFTLFRSARRYQSRFRKAFTE
jgi:hypothetical protein